jgi:putative ABC transport system substrate-binding protein
MRRREFIGLFGAATFARPLVARAQQPAMPVIGHLHPGSAATAPFLNGFRAGLAETGYVDGRNLKIEYRWADGHYDRLPTLAADLVARQVALIAVAGGTVAVLAAKAATSKVPIVFNSGTDPVADGLVQSLNRPNGNITGSYILINTLVSKQLEIMHELLPAATTFAILDNPNSPSATTRLHELNGAAGALGLKLQLLNASAESDLPVAFDSTEQHVGGVIIAADPVLTGYRDQIVALAKLHSVPIMGPIREYAAGGALTSYGTDFSEGYHLVGNYAGRILNGTPIANLPVQQSTKVDFVINLKTAKMLGLNIPLPLLGRADEVIE